LELTPQDPYTLIAGYDQVYISHDQGGSWTSISPEFFAASTIDRIALSYTNPNYIYVLVNNQIHYTTDMGVTWHPYSAPFTGTISDIIVDPKHENIMWATFSGYNTAKVAKFDTQTNKWTLD